MDTTAFIILNIIAFILGAITRETLEKLIAAHKIKNRLYKEYIRKNTECPHGYEDWDDCPDCCH